MKIKAEMTFEKAELVEMALERFTQTFGEAPAGYAPVGKEQYGLLIASWEEVDVADPTEDQEEGE